MWERGLSEDSWGFDLKVVAISIPFADIRLCKFEGSWEEFCFDGINFQIPTRHLSKH